MLYVKTLESSANEQDYYTESDEEISKHSPEPLNYDVFEDENPSPPSSPNRRLIFRQPIIPMS
jgi:hypothetical protein